MSYEKSAAKDTLSVRLRQNQERITALLDELEEAALLIERCVSGEDRRTPQAEGALGTCNDPGGLLPNLIAAQNRQEAKIGQIAGVLSAVRDSVE